MNLRLLFSPFNRADGTARSARRASRRRAARRRSLHVESLEGRRLLAVGPPNLSPWNTLAENVSSLGLAGVSSWPGGGVADGATLAEATSSSGVLQVFVQPGQTGDLQVQMFRGDDQGGLAKTRPVTPSVRGTEYSFQVKLDEAQVKVLGDGLVYSLMTFVDWSSGQPNNQYLWSSFRLDTIAPATPQVILGPGVAGGATQQEAVQPGGILQVAAEAGCNVTVQFFGQTAAGVTTPTPVVVKTFTGAGATSIPVTLSAAEVATLGQGPKTAAVTVRDAAGNTSRQDIGFSIDTIVPDVPLIDLGAGVADGATADEATQASGVITVRSAASAANTAVSDVVRVNFFTINAVGQTNPVPVLTQEWTGTSVNPVAVRLATWDLPKVGLGPKTVRVTTTDSAGNSSSSQKEFTVLSLVGTPVIALGPDVTNGATLAKATQANGVVTVSGSFGLPITVTFTCNENTVSKLLIGTGSPQSVVLTQTDVTRLGNGRVDVAASQASGGIVSATARSSFTLDTIAPVAPVLALGAGVAGGATLEEATQSSGVVTVAGENGSWITVRFTGARQISRSFWGTGLPLPLPLTAAEVTQLGNGVIAVTAFQTDRAGNVSPESTSSFTLDTIAPATPGITLGTGVENGATMAEAIQSRGLLQVSAEANARVTVSLYDVTSAGTLVSTSLVFRDLVGAGSTPIAVKLTAEDVQKLGEGPRYATVSVFDSAGNVTSRLQTFTIDTRVPVAPVLALGVGVAGGATLEEATQSSGVVTVAGENGSSIEVTFAGPQPVVKRFWGSGGPIPLALTASEVAQLGNRVIAVTAFQTDRAGNVSPVSTSSFTLDTIAPTAPVITLGTGVENGANLAEATQSSGVVTVTGENASLITVKFSGAQQISRSFWGSGAPLPLALTAAEVAQLGDQVITVTAFLNDLAGNVSAESKTSFTLDGTLPLAPLITLGAGVADGATLAEAIQPSGVVTVAGENASLITVKFSGAQQISRSFWGSGAPLPLALTAAEVAQLGNGVTVVTAIQTDQAGNVSPVSGSSFTIDTIPPAAPVITLGTGVADGATADEATQAAGIVQVSAEPRARVAATFTRVGDSTRSVSKAFPNVGSQAFGVVLTSDDVLTLGAGAVTASFVVVDAAGNMSSGSRSLSILSSRPGVVPTVSVGEPQSGQLTLSWAAPSPGTAPITSYDIMYRTGTTARKVVSTDTRAVITGLNNGSTYSFQVAAVSAAGTGNWSASVTGVPGSLPGSVSGLTATPGNGSIGLRWTAPPSQPNMPLQGYVIEHRAANDQSGLWTQRTVSAADPTATVTGLNNGTGYMVRVAAKNQIGVGSWLQSAVVVPRTVPGAVTSLTATPQDSAVSLSWQPPTTDGGVSISDYVIQYRVRSSSGPSLNWMTFEDGVSASPAALISRLNNGTTYEFQVAASNAAGLAGQGPFSVVASATPIQMRPTEPRNVSATPENGAVTVTWEAPATGSAIGRTYQVQYSTDFGGSWNDPTVQPGAATSLRVVVPNLEFYVFRVRAQNTFGEGDWSPTSQSVMPGTQYPDRPRNLTAVPGTTSVTLTWTAPSYQGTSSIVDYLIEYRLSGSSRTSGSSLYPDGWIIPANEIWWSTNSTVTQATINGLAENDGYVFRVAARNGSGRGFAAWTDAVYTAPSESIAGTTPANTPANMSASRTTPGSSGLFAGGGGMDVEVWRRSITLTQDNKGTPKIISVPGYVPKGSVRYAVYWDSGSEPLVMCNGRGFLSSMGTITPDSNSRIALSLYALDERRLNVTVELYSWATVFCDLDVDSDSDGVLRRSTREESLEDEQAAEAIVGEVAPMRFELSIWNIDSRIPVPSTNYEFLDESNQPFPDLNQQGIRRLQYDSSKITVSDDLCSWTPLKIAKGRSPDTLIKAKIRFKDDEGNSFGTAVDSVTVRGVSNELVIGIDGSFTDTWAENPSRNGYRTTSADDGTNDNLTLFTHVKNLVQDASRGGAKVIYDLGISGKGIDYVLDGGFGWRFSDIQYSIISTMTPQQWEKMNIAVVGWSRGASIAAALASFLADGKPREYSPSPVGGFNVGFVGLYDPVVMSVSTVGDATWKLKDPMVLSPRIKSHQVVAPDRQYLYESGLPNGTATNVDWPFFFRATWRMKGLGNVSGFDASHGALGGQPGWNPANLDGWRLAAHQVGEDFYQEEQFYKYNYEQDVRNSITADTLVRGRMIQAGFTSITTHAAEWYNFPEQRPSDAAVGITGFPKLDRPLIHAASVSPFTGSITLQWWGVSANKSFRIEYLEVGALMGQQAEQARWITFDPNASYRPNARSPYEIVIRNLPSGRTYLFRVGSQSLAIPGQWAYSDEKQIKL